MSPRMPPTSRSCRWRWRTAQSDYQDLVSNNNALLAVMRRKGLWQTYHGPLIRQTLQIGKQNAQWYSGYDQLLNPAIDLFNDAFCTRRRWWSCPIVLSMQEILGNEGEGQLIDVYDAYIDAAERALEDAMDAGIYSDGTANGGKQITGLGDGGPDRQHLRRVRRHRPRHRRDLAHADVRRADHEPGDRHAGQLDHDPAVCSTAIMTRQIARP